MDPVSALGLAGALIGIGDVITRSLGSLISLQSKYRSSSLVVTVIIGQLTTLKAALNQITEWATNSLVSALMHEQLVADLQVSLESCHVLIFLLEERIERLQQGVDDDGSWTIKGKIGFLLEGTGLNKFTNHLNNQVNVLNLLLTALNCRTTFERTELLGNNESRQIIKRIEDNRTSLLTLRDTGSQCTNTNTATENWSLLDREFDFDQNVITTHVYRAAMRSNMRTATHNMKGKMPLLNGDLVETMPEMEEEDPAVVRKPQTELHSSHQQDWSQQSLLRHPRIEERALSISQLQEGDEENQEHLDVRHSSSDEEDGPASPVKIQVKKTDIVNQASILALAPLDLPPLMRQENMRSGLKRKGKTIWRLRIPKLFTNPASLDVPASVVSETQSSPPAQQTKVLFLGTSESGKSTLLKTLKLAFGGNFNLEERLCFKDIIFSNTVQSMRVILEAMEFLEIPIYGHKTEHYVLTIFMQPAQIEDDSLSLEVCEAIEELWKDGGVKKAFERSREYQLSDGAAYFFDDIRRIADPHYTPTDIDILMSRIKTTGITETKFEFNGQITRFFDVGGTRSERRKWIHVFEKVNVIIFTVDIAAYDQLLFEDESINRIDEALSLFDSIVNSRWFTNTRVILLFTKMDKLEKKTYKSPIKNYVPDFEGDGESVEDVKAYTERRFLELSQRPEKDIKVMFMSFKDGYNIAAQEVFDALGKIIL